MKTVEDGVANFKNFKDDMRGKVGFVYGATWLGGIVGAIMLSALGYCLIQGVQFVQSMEEFKQEFHEVHKSQLPDKKSLYTSPEQVYSVRNQLQTAGGFYQ